jgi:hypothetical protein
MSSSKDIAIDIIPLEQSQRNHISRRPAFARDDSPSAGTSGIRYEPFRRRGAYAELSGEERGNRNDEDPDGATRYGIFISKFNESGMNPLQNFSQH